MKWRIPKSPPPADAVSSVSVADTEAMLADWFGSPVVLTSSGRSALLLILQELGFARYTHSVAVPRFISRCVLDAIIQTAFPVDAADSHAADAAVHYHQYGFTQRVRPAGVVIEDIAHAFFSVSEPDQPRTLAIFSLPKFFSTASMVGGAVVTDLSLAHRMRQRRDAAPSKSANALAKESLIFRSSAEEGNGQRSLLYTARLQNSRIEDAELGGVPATRSEMSDVRRRRGEVMEALLTAAGRLIPSGWADMLRSQLPYAFPVSSSEHVLARLNRDLQEAGIESDIYRIDVNRDMTHPRYEPMLLIPYSHLVPDAALTDMERILRTTAL